MAVGDTVTFLSIDKGHNAESILDMIPADAQHWKGKIDEEFTVTLSAPGVYGLKCSPHFAMGMVMLVVVGDEGAVDLPADLPERAADRFDAILAAQPQ